jgi:hypothetical protein
MQRRGFKAAQRHGFKAALDQLINEAASLQAAKLASVNA